MNEYCYLKPAQNAVVLALLASTLSGCLTDEKVKSAEETLINNEVSGSVGDGPIVGATMSVIRNDGQELVRLESDTNAEYGVTVKTKIKYYPLTINARDGIDLVTNLAPDFDLVGVVVEPGDQTVANINPFSTFAVAIARELPGGVTKANIETGQDIAATSLNNGLSTLASSGPLATQIDNSNISQIVKASEGLAETVRRTRNLLTSFGYFASGDEVVLRLASDLSDRTMDGRGGFRTDARTAAIAKVVAAQVLLESMSNELHVNGANATSAMKSAIDQVGSTTPQVTIDDLSATSEMLLATRIGLAAALAVSEIPKLVQLDQAVSGLQPGMDPMLVQTLLPDDYRATLDSALAIVAGGNASVIATINNINEPGGSESPTNRGPSIQGVPSTVAQVGSPYSFSPNASDPDGDSLTFSITGQPAWASFNESIGELSGTPSADHVATYSNIVIGVTDGALSSSLPAFSISVTVVATNSPPVISGNPPSNINANSAYSFTPNASDADEDTLIFSVSGLPDWASFSTTTGRISGTPDDTDVGVYNGITVTVDDGSANASLGPFSITVDAVATNSPPVISGNPTSNINANGAYSFTPNASDADDDTLIFSVSGLPEWASFSTTTGRISGTPDDTDVGVYSGITITVDDGSANASLGPFSITVDAISLGSVTLNWTAPTQNEDGTPLIDLVGYRIYWGTGTGNYPNSVTINSAGVTTYVVQNLASGTYEFVATSFNGAGAEITYSNLAVITVP